MSGVKWVRLDTAFPRNHKIVAVISEPGGYRSAFVWTCALAYAGEQGTAGFIPRQALPFLNATKKDVDRLVAARLFIPDPDGGGWWINDWAEYQPSNDEVTARSERARKAAAARWSKENERSP